MRVQITSFNVEETDESIAHADDILGLFQVMKGMGIVHEIENTDKGENDKPVNDVVIDECGQLQPGEDVRKF